MAFDFPASPTVGQVYNGYTWNGYAWSMSGSVTVTAPPGDAPPSNPVPGQLWWESDSGNLFVWYVDANTSQWVQINGPGLGDAPSDGAQYLRQSGIWVRREAVNRLISTSVGIIMDVEPDTLYRGAARLRGSADATAYLQFATTSGNFINSASSYAYQQMTASAATVTASASSNPGIPLAGLDAGAGWPSLVEFVLYTGATGQNASAMTAAGGVHSDGASRVYSTGGALNAVGPIVQIRVAVDAGNLVAGSLISLERVG